MQRNYFFVFLVLLTFFVVSFITNILGPIMPAANSSLHLSLSLAGFLPLSFFFAYGPTSIPAGYLTEKYGSKFVILLGFITATIGCLILVSFPGFISYIISLFIMGMGMAMLQVVINPLLRASGGEENYSFFSVLAQLVFGGASFLSPAVYSYLMLNLPGAKVGGGLLGILANLVPDNLLWVTFYWLCGFIGLVMIMILSLIKFPRVELNTEEKVESFATVLKLFKNKVVIVYFFGIFAYVGTEQGVSVWISKFLQVYLAADPDTVGAHTTALFWGMQCAGGILGLLLLKLFDVRLVMGTFILLGMITLALALFGSSGTSLLAFPAFGFFTSVMYPGVFSLGLNSLKSHHGTFAGIMCSGIIGGAVIPFFVGIIGDYYGLKIGMCLVFLPLLYMLLIAICARPLIKNKTIFSRE